jgi:Carboxylesterase family
MHFSGLALLFTLLVVTVNGLIANPQVARLPQLQLPYGTWQAKEYDKSGDVRHPQNRSVRFLANFLKFYIFKNIRYAAPPVGDLRFSKPAPPMPNSTFQTGDYGEECINSIAGFIPATSLNGAISKVLSGSEGLLHVLRQVQVLIRTQTVFSSMFTFPPRLLALAPLQNFQVRLTPATFVSVK